MHLISKIKLKWDGLRLHLKFWILMVLLLLIPVTFFIFFFFDQMIESNQDQLVSRAKQDLTLTITSAEGNYNVARSMISTVSRDVQLQMFDRAHTNAEISLFHETWLPHLRNLVATNPYVRNLRIYIDPRKTPETLPWFVHRDRVHGEGWFWQSDANEVQMRIGYYESFSDLLPTSVDQLVSFNKTINHSDGDKNVLEVSYTMADFFGESYGNGDDILLFLYHEGQFYNGEGFSSQQDAFYEALLWAQDPLYEGEQIIQKDGVEYLVVSDHSTALDITCYGVQNLTENLAPIYETQSRLFLVILVSVGLLTILFRYLTKKLLRRIYNTMDVMHQDVEFNSLVKIEETSTDEVGKLERYFNSMVDRMNEMIREESRRAVIEKETELKALQSQINAHFLYNVLNDIEMMAIIEQNYLIADSITALARLLRYSMSWDAQMVPLERELSYVTDYIQLFNMRFDNNVRLILDVPDTAKQVLIPKMGIQPVVENALIHGVEHLNSDEIIRISATVAEDVLTLGITDSGGGMDEETLQRLNTALEQDRKTEQLTGIGLYNVQQRIQMRYGKEYGLHIESKLSEYTKVTMKLPTKSEDQLPTEVDHEKYFDR